MSYAIVAEGLGDYAKWSEETDRQVETSVVQALNKTADRVRTEAAREILRQTNFPASYVAPAQGRLAVASRATRSKPEAVIRARGRATSLARFVIGGGERGKAIQLAVKPGSSKILKSAFLINLRSGNSDTLGNKGLAIRLRPGQRPRGTTRAVAMKNGLFLLYGPSVAQLFINNAGGGVAEQLTPDALDYLEAEFDRLMSL